MQEASNLASFRCHEGRIETPRYPKESDAGTVWPTLPRSACDQLRDVCLLRVPLSFFV